MVFIEHLRGGTPRGTTTVSPILCLMNWNDEHCRQFKHYIPKFASNYDGPRHAPQPPSPAYDYEEVGEEEEEDEKKDHGIADRSMNYVSGETAGRVHDGVESDYLWGFSKHCFFSGFFSPVLPTVTDLQPSARQSEREFRATRCGLLGIWCCVQLQLSFRPYFLPLLAQSRFLINWHRLSIHS